MDPKPHPNDLRYIETLRAMTPDQRLRKALELTEFGRRLFAEGLRLIHPDLPDDEFRRLYLAHLERCHNTNY